MFLNLRISRYLVILQYHANIYRGTILPNTAQPYLLYLTMASCQSSYLPCLKHSRLNLPHAWTTIGFFSCNLLSLNHIRLSVFSLTTEQAQFTSCLNHHRLLFLQPTQSESHQTISILTHRMLEPQQAHLLPHCLCHQFLDWFMY